MKALHNKEKKKKDFTPLLNQGGAEACKNLSDVNKNIKTFKCDVCDMGFFGNQRIWKRHFKSLHNKDKKDVNVQHSELIRCR